MLGQDSFNWVPTKPKLNGFNSKVFHAGTFEPTVFTNGIANGGVQKSKDFETYFTMWQDGERGADVQPFKELLISGNEGDQFSWSSGQGGTRIDLHNNFTENCGNLEFVINNGWTMEVYIKTGNADYFYDNLSSKALDGDYDDRLDIGGVEDYDSKLYAIMVGGDKLSLDICSDYSGTSALYLKSMGVNMGDGEESPAHDWVIVDIQNISYKDPNTSDDANGSDNGCEQDNTEPGDDGNCVCVSGYILDTDENSDTYNECIKSNTMIYVGVGGAILVGLLLFGN